MRFSKKKQTKKSKSEQKQHVEATSQANFPLACNNQDRSSLLRLHQMEHTPMLMNCVWRWWLAEFPPLSSFSCNNGRQGTYTARPLALRVGEGHGVRNIYHSTCETLHSNTLLLPCCEAAVDLVHGFMEFRWRSSTTCGTTLPNSKACSFLAPAAHLIKYRNSRWGKCNLVLHCAHQDAGLFALFPSWNSSCKKLKDSRTTVLLRQ